MTESIASSAGIEPTNRLILDGREVVLRHPSVEDHLYKTVASTHTFYEQTLLQASTTFLQPGDVVVDAGANIGNHSIFWALSSKCRVIAYEPVPDIFDLLVENIVKNGLQRQIVPKRVALAEAEGWARVKEFNANNIGATSLELQAEPGTIRVMDLDSDSLFVDAELKLLKIDVEGLEFEVIQGARKLLSRDRPIVICECATTESFQAVSQLLGGHGYVPIECFNATPTYMFVHRSEFANDDEKSLSYSLSATLRLSKKNLELAEKVALQGRRLASLEEKISQLEKANETPNV